MAEAFDPDKYLAEKAPQAAQAPSDGFDPDKYLAEKSEAGPQESPGLIGRMANGLVGGLSKVARTIDSYSGAPTRAAIMAAQNGENPLPAFASQFGGDPEKAPTGLAIAKKAGLSDVRPTYMTAAQVKAWNDQNDRMSGGMNVRIPEQDQQSWSPAQIGGAGIELAADPTNLIPIVGESKYVKPLLGRAGKAIAAPISKGTEAVADALKSGAEKAAVNATGATASQASAFADNAGRELLDRGIVKFGDNQAQIASRASDAVKGAEGKIDEALKALDAQGVKVDTAKVRRDLVDKVREMSGKSSEQDILKAVNNEISNIKDAAQARGSDLQMISEAEAEKRGYSRKARNWQNPDVGQAGKNAYLSYRDAVEEAARAADPKTAELFEEGKKTYGLLDPIEEAAQKRALTQQQAWPINLKDLAALKLGGVPGYLGNKMITPRLASSAAVTMDSAANMLRKVPELSALEAKDPVMFNKIVQLAYDRGGLLGKGAPKGLVADQQRPSLLLQSEGNQ